METAGFILATVAIVLLGVGVTIFDLCIRKAKGELDGMSDDRDTRMTHNWPLYISHSAIVQILRLNKMFMNRFGKPQEAQNVEEELMKARGEVVAKLHLALTGQVPPKDKIVEWQKITASKLSAEQINIWKTETTMELLGNITDKKAVVSELEKKKTWVIITATVLQVIALMLLQIASKN